MKKVFIQHKKIILSLIILVFIISVAFLTLKMGRQTIYKKGSSRFYDTVVFNATTLYKKRTAEGFSVDNGPCLTNDLMTDWVVDLVHSPRQQLDNLPENQCQAFIEGRAKHIVELDLKGNLVRIF